MKNAAKEFNENASQKTINAIESVDPGCGKIFNRNVCLAKHFAAKKREIMGLRHEYEPCGYCPLVLQIIDNEKSRKKEEK